MFLLSLTGCEKRKDIFLNDVDEISRYIVETEQGIDLFRATELIPTITYSVPFDSDPYRDSVTSQTRKITVLVDTVAVEYAGLGQVLEAWATVEDRISVTTIIERADFADTLRGVRVLTRYGFFLKLGNDSHDYLGWLLWGYNPIGEFPTPVNVRVSYLDGEDSVTFFGDLSAYSTRHNGASDGKPGVTDNISVRFQQVLELKTIPNGGKLVLQTNTANGSSPVRYYQHISSFTGSGVEHSLMSRVNRDISRDTLKTPDDNPRLWNILFIQSFEDERAQFSKCWCIPYRSAQ